MIPAVPSSAPWVGENLEAGARCGRTGPAGSGVRGRETGARPRHAAAAGREKGWAAPLR
ncbi:hypothetical protein GCM10022214_65130 [Actinomadura miaoliensis]|uniref:Uncharacterized protein n=1 Tax=Actinomadura miaoliensis TaxID=430685 RepID=A0ABP7WQL1_9ACTN